jgi:tRNA U34 5-methylaminomethyl-2-thiouridine-forming methyltransferase MnmC
MKKDDDFSDIVPFQTADGSYTLLHEKLGETYHSRNGALTESQYVYVEKGLRSLGEKKSIAILEVGFGTGLNAWLSLQYAQDRRQNIHYTALEPLPLPKTLCLQPKSNMDQSAEWDLIHDTEWEKQHQLTPYFQLTKMQTTIEAFDGTRDSFDLVFFDAFAPNYQSDIWSLPIFHKLFETMRCSAILVTYCAKGEVRRTLQAVGFLVERLPGPPGKRQMLRASKP